MDANNQIEFAVSVPKKTGGSAMKILIIGLPLFIIQVIAVYFITANILLNRMQREMDEKMVGKVIQKGDKPGTGKESKESSAELGKFIYPIDDIIVNPAGTEGKKIFLMSIAFDLGSDADKTTFKDKDLIIRDAIITTTARKNLRQLNDIVYRDTLKSEIVQQINSIIPDAKINKVYFSKFIIN